MNNLVGSRDPFVSILWLLLFALSLPSLALAHPEQLIAVSPTTSPAPRAKKTTPPAKPKATPKPKKISFKAWLGVGPFTAPMPVFHKEKHGKYTHKQLLTEAHLHLATLRPEAGQKVHWFPAQTLSWAPSKGKFKAAPKHAQVGYLATSFEVPQYMELTLKLRSHQRIRAFLDGQLIATKWTCTKAPKKSKKKGSKAKQPKQAKDASPSTRKAKSKTSVETAEPKDPKQALLWRMTQLLSQQSKILQKQADTIAKQGQAIAHLRDGIALPAPKAPTKPKPGLAQALLRLTPGVHRLILKTLYTPECLHKWKVKGSLHSNPKHPIPSEFRVTTTPKERHSIAFLLQRKRIQSVSLSPDGREVLLRLSRMNAKGASEYWVEQRRISNGQLLYSSRPYFWLNQLQWSPDGLRFSFVSGRGKQGSTLWLANRITKSIRALRRNIQHFQYYAWSPTGRFLVVYTMRREKPTATEKTGVKRLRGMGDRWPWYRIHSNMYALTIPGGSMMRLTAGQWGLTGLSIRKDGKKLLFGRSHPDFSKRPFRYLSLHELDLTTLKTKTIFKKLYWAYGFTYSPNGKQILLTGGSSLFGKVGHGPQLPEDAEPNQYQTQIYTYNIAQNSIKTLTWGFKPSVQTAIWHPFDNQIYFTALNKTRIQLYKYNPDTHTHSRLETDADIASRISFARNSSVIAYVGEGIKHPGWLYTLDLHNPQPTRLYMPAAKWFARLHLGRVQDWATHSDDGVQLEGRVYYPPDFDARKKYPAIVYYYGGTYPTTRNFDGRYPKQLWAAHGYIVYTLQPSGAIGFGQQHAARHVNEWGTIVAQEIIDATKKFLKAHPYVDGKRVGCIGASYGGFMTMSIVTKTKLFAAAISHAGISNITSYWGSGFWGYLYSAIATAHRYPWTHPYFYVKNSPLFSAHKIKTPLLLLHGDSDTNVPPSESYQMYAALRLLKKPVELILMRGSDHWVLRYHKRVLWTQTILAWFDRHLKKQPLWFKRLHGTKQR